MKHINVVCSILYTSRETEVRVLLYRRLCLCVSLAPQILYFLYVSCLHVMKNDYILYYIFFYTAHRYTDIQIRSKCRYILIIFYLYQYPYLQLTIQVHFFHNTHLISIILYNLLIIDFSNIIYVIYSILNYNNII